MAEECIDIGSKIVTIAIMMHGEIIETKLSPAQQKIFDSTRLFSLVGGFSEAGLGANEVRTDNINYLNSTFYNNYNLQITNYKLQSINYLIFFFIFFFFFIIIWELFNSL